MLEISNYYYQSNKQVIRYEFSALAFFKSLSWRQPRRSNQRRSTKEHTRKERTKNNRSSDRSIMLVINQQHTREERDHVRASRYICALWPILTGLSNQHTEQQHRCQDGMNYSHTRDTMETGFEQLGYTTTGLTPGILPSIYHWVLPRKGEWVVPKVMWLRGKADKPILSHSPRTLIPLWPHKAEQWATTELYKPWNSREGPILYPEVPVECSEASVITKYKLTALMLGLQKHYTRCTISSNHSWNGFAKSASSM